MLDDDNIDQDEMDDGVDAQPRKKYMDQLVRPFSPRLASLCEHSLQMLTLDLVQQRVANRDEERIVIDLEDLKDVRDLASLQMSARSRR